MQENSGDQDITEEFTKKIEEVAEKQEEKKRFELSTLLIIVAVLALLVGLSIYGVSKIRNIHITSSTTSINPFLILSCTNITSPGTYTLEGNITPSSIGSSCIYIKSSNVEINGQYHSIVGKGPFVELAPYSYGIYASNQSNITVRNLRIERFSFGIYLLNSKNALLSGLALTNATLSDLYLNKSENITLSESLVESSSSPFGAINLENSSFNTFISDKILTNAYLGVLANGQSFNNTFSNLNFSSNPLDLKCSLYSGIYSKNKAFGLKCSNNHYCNFASCASNIPDNVPSIVLGSHISSCGSIRYPGNYVVESDINQTNVFGSAANEYPCISINSQNVKLDCNGNSIYDGSIGVYIYNSTNVSLENCNIYSNEEGIMVNGSSLISIKNVSLYRNNYGIALYYSAGINMSKLNIFNNTISGIGIFNVTGFNIGHSTVSNNLNDGIFFSSGEGGIITNSTLISNRHDLYCSASTYNSTSNLISNSSCGITDCSWAKCRSFEVPPVEYYPIDSCYEINSPGKYLLAKSVVATQNLSACIHVNASNVEINCNNNTIEGLKNKFGILVSNEKSISLEDCNIGGFDYGIELENSSNVTLLSPSISSVNTSIMILNSSNVFVSKSSSSNQNSSVIAKNSKNLLIANSVSRGIRSGYGIMLSNVTGSLISFDNVSNFNIGMDFSNSSNNVVNNDTSLVNSAYDYFCSGTSTSINSNTGVDLGETKGNCAWLAVLSSYSPPTICQTVRNPSFISLTSDFLFHYGGATCIYVVSNATSKAAGTTINCQNHTIIASLPGDTFINVENTTNVRLENCYIKNFGSLVNGYNSSISIINNSIFNASKAIALESGLNVNISRNRIINSSFGIIYEIGSGGSIMYNNITNANISIELSGVSGMNIYNNYVKGGTIGAYLINATSSRFKGNTFVSSKYGLLCQLASSSQNADVDQGGNVCSSNKNCLWVTSPSCLT
ncbi:MAG: NosD domain-containing protein [Candidatus Micrarchaeaceae archaeon]